MSKVNKIIACSNHNKCIYVEEAIKKENSRIIQELKEKRMNSKVLPKLNNLGMTREQTIYNLLISLNNGNSVTVEDRIYKAIMQYNQLVEEEIIVKEEDV